MLKSNYKLLKQTVYSLYHIKAIIDQTIVNLENNETFDTCMLTHKLSNI